MSKRIVYLFPGQGAQYVGMGKAFYDQFASSREIFEEADDLLRTPLTRLIFEGPENELTLTKNSQVAIFVTSMALLRAFHHEFPEMTPSICAGLSLGEYTALVCAGKISFADGLSLVRARGQFMHEACLSSPGTMRVVLGLDVDKVRSVLPPGVWVANLNCPGQVVIAGAEKHLAAVEPLLKAQGAKRVLPIDVSGAFHTPHMQEAQEKLAPLIERTAIRESSIAVVMNALGASPNSDAELRKALIAQVTSPVLWEKGIREIEKEPVEIYVEIGCGTTLRGMNKKIDVKAPTITIEKVENLEEFAQHVFAQR
ncbi:MAG: ACP S-malonyltransferase [Chlamydiales bacterium]